MLAIRLMPMGKKGQKFFRIVVSEKTKDIFGTYREQVGTMNPQANPREVILKEDRVRYWLEKGAQPSGTVHNLLVDAKLIDGKKVHVSKTKPKKAEGADSEAPAAADAKPVDSPAADASSTEAKPADKTPKSEETKE